MYNEKIYFTNSNNETLTGNLYLPADTRKRAVIFAHCFTCSRHTTILRDCSQILYENGFVTLRFDFSGNGQSEGDFSDTSYSKYIDDLLSAIHYLKQFGTTDFGLAGHSMGAAISLLTASQCADVKAVCTLAGRYSNLNLSHLIGESKQKELESTGSVRFISRNRQLSLSNHFLEDLKNHNLPDIVRNLKQPLLAIHGEEDLTIPVTELTYSQKLKPKNTETLVVKDADHMFSSAQDRNLIADKLVNWFDTQVKPHPFN